MFIKGSIGSQTVLGLLRGLNLVGLSGALTLVHRSGQALLVLRRGQLLHIATSSARESVGSALVLDGVISRSQLEQALDVQFEGEEPRRLGALLVAQGLASQEAVARTLRRHVLDQLQEVVAWTRGVYRFEQLFVPDEEDLSFSLVSLLDELGPPSTAKAGAESASEEDDEALMAVFGNGPESTHEIRAKALPQLMHQVQHVTFEAELILQLLDYTSQFVDRGVLVQNGPDGFRGIAQFGLETSGKSPNEKIRRLVLPADQPSIFRDVTESGLPALGPLQPTPVNADLVEILDGRVPTCALALPFKIGNEVSMIIYGDVAGDRPIEAVELLEAAISQASLALERSSLQARIDQLEKQLKNTLVGPVARLESGGLMGAA